MRDSAHPLIGRVFGNYVARAFLGQGGAGTVLMAEYRFLGERVALKVLGGAYAGHAETAHRFFQEATATRSIDHPNVVRIHDFGETDDGGLYLVMELLEGENLGAALERGPLGEGEAARIGISIANGLAAAHAKGIVHRDLKPDNVFLAGEAVKLLDFGIAKVLSNARTGTGTVLGTPQYMAPEQTRGAKHVGPHTDVYSLGALLFEMVAGRPPFIVDADDDVAVLLMKIVTLTPPRPSDFATVSPEFNTLILECLEKDPARRPAPISEVARRLALLATAPARALVGGESGTAAVIPPVDAAEVRANTPMAAGDMVALDLESPRPRRRRRVLFAAGIIGVATIAIGSVALRNRTQTEQPVPEKKPGNEVTALVAEADPTMPLPASAAVVVEETRAAPNAPRRQALGAQHTATSNPTHSPRAVAALPGRAPAAPHPAFPRVVPPPSLLSAVHPETPPQKSETPEDPVEEAFRARREVAAAAVERGDWATALRQFKSAFVLRHDSSLLERIGYCYEHQGATANAIGAYRTFLATSTGAGSHADVAARLVRLEAIAHDPNTAAAAVRGAVANSPTAKLPDRISRAQMKAVLKTIVRRVAACFDAETVPAGEIDSITVGRSGKVIQVDVSAAENAHCVANALRRATFPQFSGPPMKVPNPFSEP